MSRIHVALIAVGLALAPIGLAWSHDEDQSSLEQILVESATTPQQHAALAKYYRGKASEARERAAEHKRMGASYGGTKMAIAQAGKEHCDKLAALNESTAAEYDKMASEHDSLATKK